MNRFFMDRLSIGRLCLLSLVLSVFLSSLAWATPCDRELNPSEYFRPQTNGKILFGPGANARVYPQFYTLENMGITEAQIVALKGQVLLLGEGYGNLLPLFLKAPNVQVLAVDPLYGLKPIPEGFMGEGLAEYIAKYSPHLDSSSSDRLRATSNSIDYVFSHLLLNNLIEIKLKSDGTPEVDANKEPIYDFSTIAIGTVRETIRVLKPGGHAVFAALLTEGDANHLMDLITADGHSPQELGYSFSFETFERVTDYKLFGKFAPDLQNNEPFTDPMCRLTIIKNR